MSEKSQKSQEKSPSKLRESKNSLPVDCPFARNGIVEALHKLTDEDGLLMRAVVEQKKGNKLTRESNELARSNSKMLRAVILMFIFAVLVLLVTGGLAYLIFKDVVVVEQNMGKSVAKQDQMIEDVKKLVEGQKRTGEKLDDAKEVLDSKPTVELVPEEDPVKAKDAPLKVRIVPAKTPNKKPAAGDKPEPPVPATTAVEVPLPVKDAQAVKK